MKSTRTYSHQIEQDSCLPAWFLWWLVTTLENPYPVFVDLPVDRWAPSGLSFPPAPPEYPRSRWRTSCAAAECLLAAPLGHSASPTSPAIHLVVTRIILRLNKTTPVLRQPLYSGHFKIKFWDLNLQLHAYIDSLHMCTHHIDLSSLKSTR